MLKLLFVGDKKEDKSGVEKSENSRKIVFFEDFLGNGVGGDTDNGFIIGLLRF